MSFSAGSETPWWFTPAFFGVWLLGVFCVVSHLITRRSLDVEGLRRRAKQLDEGLVIAAFQERRTRWLWMSGTPLFAGTGLMALAMFGPEVLDLLGFPPPGPGIPGLDPELWLAVGLALFAWGFLSTQLFYRCPACEEIMVGADQVYFNPATCRTCGVGLRRR